MQGDPLLIAILNAVVDTVVFQWESFVAEGAGGDTSDDDAAHPESRTIRERDNGQRRMEEGHTWLKVKAYFFYKDDGMVDSTYPGWLQTAFDMLMGLFDRVDPKKNFRETVGMVCHPCQAPGVRADKDYTWQITGAGRR